MVIGQFTTIAKGSIATLAKLVLTDWARGHSSMKFFNSSIVEK